MSKCNVVDLWPWGAPWRSGFAAAAALAAQPFYACALSQTLLVLFFLQIMSSPDVCMVRQGLSPCQQGATHVHYPYLCRSNACARPHTPVQEQLVDKLKLLEYEKEFCKKKWVHAPSSSQLDDDGTPLAVFRLHDHLHHHLHFMQEAIPETLDPGVLCGAPPTEQPGRAVLLLHQLGEPAHTHTQC